MLAVHPTCVMFISWCWLKSWFSVRELSKVRYKRHDLGNWVGIICWNSVIGLQFSYISYAYGCYCCKLVELEACLVILVYICLVLFFSVTFILYSLVLLFIVTFIAYHVLLSSWLDNLDAFNAAIPINYDEFMFMFDACKNSLAGVGIIV